MLYNSRLDFRPCTDDIDTSTLDLAAFLGAFRMDLDVRFPGFCAVFLLTRGAISLAT